MSKTSKAKTKQENLQKKRAIKASRKAQYQAWKEAGQNSKSKRSRKAGKRNQKAHTISHPQGPCGNIGCRRCDPNKIFATGAVA